MTYTENPGQYDTAATVALFRELVAQAQAMTDSDAEAAYTALRDGIHEEYDRLQRAGKYLAFARNAGKPAACVDSLEQEQERDRADYDERTLRKSILAVRTGRLAMFSRGSQKVTA